MEAGPATAPPRLARREKPAQATTEMSEEDRSEVYRSLRGRVGSQAVVARLLGVHSDTVAGRERGRMRVTNEAMLALERLLEKTPPPRGIKGPVAHDLGGGGGEEAERA